MKLRTLCCPLLLAAILSSGCEVGIEGEPQAGHRVHSGGQSIVALGEVQFVSGYAAGNRAAVAQGKPMLLFFTATWCKFCHELADEAFNNPQIVSLANRFVCVSIDADAEPEVCRQFNVTGYPTIQFVSARGVPLERMVGKKPGHQLIQAMQAALQSVARHDADGDSLLR